MKWLSRTFGAVNGDFNLALPQIRCSGAVGAVKRFLAFHDCKARNRFLRSSMPARPYICRFGSFNLLM